MSTEKFTLDADNLNKVAEIIAKYPEDRKKSATLPLLDLAQRQNGGWLSVPAIEWVAETVEQPYMRVYEVASFYTMYNLKPVGKYHIQLCGTTPCWLRGSDEVKKAFEAQTGAKCGSSCPNKLFTITEVECLGACRNAPVVQINDDFYEDLTVQSVTELVAQLKKQN